MLFALFFILLSVNIFQSSEIEYGICETWIKLKNHEWQETPVTNVSLDIYETFYIKAKITTKVRCRVALELEGAGFTKTFEVIKGPSKYSQAICHGEKPKGWNNTYIWKIRPTDNKFAGGTTPLKLYVQYKKKYDDHWHSEYEYDKKSEYVKLISPQINYTLWGGYQENTDSVDSDIFKQNNTGGSNTAGFEIVYLLLATFLVAFFIRKNN